MDTLDTLARDNMPPHWKTAVRSEQRIYWQAYVGKYCVETCVRGSADCKEDTRLMTRVLEFKYAAIRQNKVLVVDFVPKWKAWILKHVLHVVLE